MYLLPVTIGKRSSKKRALFPRDECRRRALACPISKRHSLHPGLPLPQTPLTATNSPYYSAASTRQLSNSRSRFADTTSSPPPPGKKASAFPAKRPSLYEELGVPVTATQSDIKQAFLTLAKKHHPDVVKDNVTEEDAGETFRKIRHAYSVLSDEDRKREYDWMTRGVWKHPSSSSGSKAGVGGAAGEAADYLKERKAKLFKDWEERRQKGGLGQEEARESPQAFRYTEEEMAAFQELELERSRQYDYVLQEKMREVVRLKEALRLKTYEEAKKHYAANVEVLSDNEGKESSGDGDKSAAEKFPLDHESFEKLVGSRDEKASGPLWAMGQFVGHVRRSMCHLLRKVTKKIWMKISSSSSS